MDEVTKKNIRVKIFYFFIALVGMLFLLSIITYNPQDPSLFTFSKEKPHNIFGIIGATIADFFFQSIGFSAYLIPLAIFIVVFNKIKSIFKLSKIDIFFFIFFIFIFSTYIQLIFPDVITFYNEKNFIPGGIIGKILCNWLITYINPTGAFLFLTLSLIFLFSIIFDIKFKDYLKIFKFFSNIKIQNFPKFKIPKIRFPKFKSKKEEILILNEKNEIDDKGLLISEENDSESDSENSINHNVEKKVEKKEINVKKKKSNKFAFPKIDFLEKPQKKSEDKTNGELEEKAKKLLDKFSDFNITGEIVNIIKGPAVTLFEFKPASGIKLSKITSLQNDILMALKAKSVRIVAPIPGKDVVGIEVSNKDRETVYFRELIESEEYKKSKSPLTIALGKTIDGKSYVSDLAKMPHLLVAGSTGSGKSVCINVILASFLYKATFKDVKLILIDPKKLELSLYNGIPHLLLPVIYEPEKAPIALKWAIFEMERRYDLLTEAGVRDINHYNEKVSDEDKLPFIVIVIDELADLMMTAPKEVETLIARLTQKARAAGIHMILATQRPSVDVITGLIKNNLPSRIAFKVTSRADSRTILDHMGAESLLGMGDMLFLPPGSSNVVRLQGAFISEKEIIQIIEYLKQFSDEVDYKEEEILNFSDENLKKEYRINGLNSNNSYDPLWDQAVEFVSHLEEVSISLLQRKFKIGYNRAAKIIEKMEEEEIVGPADGSKPRKVLINPI